MNIYTGFCDDYRRWATRKTCRTIWGERDTKAQKMLDHRSTADFFFFFLRVGHGQIESCKFYRMQWCMTTHGKLYEPLIIYLEWAHSYVRLLFRIFFFFVCDTDGGTGPFNLYMLCMRIPQYIYTFHTEISLLPEPSTNTHTNTCL